ncbi:MAG: HAD hydrolase-like protein [Cytophagales bacterium]|jgi:phosphonatase-like hydrolase|nr:HAD hydrolase-like protein [Cytophagales bacterium]MCA6387416.1 HAD hydrolase-like protein [Cytophagales bacterium]MCA6390201.1 HAD hydrolase-like protein [Cytophagales bacterium]MCA6396808.1 HAD hydrolase-like protein [Cytophagales bacterium]MCA6397904.1 HAD hydrolase-like protein [Cytophagales bacterium]
MIDLIVFDLAGTTVKENFDVQRTLKNSFSKVGLEISIAQASQVMGIPKPVAIRQLLESVNCSTISDDLIRSIHADFVEDMILFYENDQTVAENEGVSETFHLLKAAGIKVFVDTGFDRPIVDALLQRMAWEKNKLIDGSVTSDEVAHGRPHPDLIFRAMELSGVSDVKRVAKVGDTVSDLAEGNAAGCGLVIGITTGAFTKEQLSTVPHTHLISQIPEVLGIINSRASIV